MSASSNPFVPLYPVVSEDITVNTSKSPLMRLYVPTKAALNGRKKLPLVVYYHHGGFTTTSVDFICNQEFCNTMALELNVIVASPSYRLAPEHRLPGAYEDGVAALKWIIYNSSDNECIKSFADISNVYLMGTGFGGNLAYNVGVRVSDQLGPLQRIRGLILHQPFLGGQERCESELSLSDQYWELCLPVGVNRDHEYSNPTVGDGPNIIRRWGWKVLVCGREGDPMVDRHKGVAKLMKEKGVDVIECFTDANVVDERAQLFASITSFIHSSAP